jgi:tryptophan synthase beta subunit
MEFSNETIESIIMAASMGQFGAQIVSETFSYAVQELSEAKKQLFNALTSGAAAFLAYFFTANEFVAKAALLALISGIFAEAALRLLKKKNDATKQKSEELAAKLAQTENQAQLDRIKELADKLKLLEK